MPARTDHSSRSSRISRVKSGLILALLAFLFSWSASAAAQVDYGNQPPPRTVPETPQQPDQQNEQPINTEPLTTLKVNVNLVNLYFNVKDHHGGLVGGLNKEDFQVFEDGKPENVKRFVREADQPLTLGILIDTSVSQTRVLPMTREIGAQFLRDVIRPKDMAFLISFDVNVDLLQDYTSSVHDLRVALDKTRINGGGGFGGGIPGIGQGPIPTTSIPRGTLLYDAIYLASNEKLRQEVGRKAIIILTDGEDQGSQLRIQDAIEAAQKSDVIVYVILEADRGVYPSGDAEMKKVCGETGGRVIDVGNNYEKLKKAFQQISEELRTQYNIAYTPINQKRDGTFRKIEIRVNNKDYKVQARKGYYAPRD
ncbi:MAG TPA: VWA domain-containing protein [Candidatus Acidoferrales bacterium]|nr:VWA domain-containing protein [Candidatus Acidoferrales bacterium]